MMILKRRIMKKIILSTFVLASLVMLNVGCKKPRPIEEFDIPFTTDFVVTAATFTPGVNDFYATVIPNIGTYWDAHKLNSDIVGEIYCTSFVFNIKSPVGQNLNFAKNYEFFMQGGDQKEVRMNHIDPWMGPTPTQTIVSSVVSTSTAQPVNCRIDGDCVGAPLAGGFCSQYHGINLKNYFIQNSIRFRMRAEWRNNVPSDVTITASYTVHVKGIQ